MRPPLFQLQDVLKAFKRKKILTKEQLLESTGCSTMTAWRLLRQHGYFTSYNENARYYTIKGIPEFDEYGLWCYGQVQFSQWGSLTQTIVKLVEASSAGLDAGQLQQLLKVENVKPSLTQLVHKQSLAREKLKGRYVYFPVQAATRREQRKQRKDKFEEARAARVLPPLEQIIALLVEIIKRPKATPRQWARRLTQQGVRIGMAGVQAVLDHYQIEEKKTR